MRVVLLGDSHLARLRRELTAIGPDVHNAAVGGSCAVDLLPQADGADIGEHDAVVVSVGTNDAAPWRHVGVDDFACSLRACLTSLPARRRVYLTPPGVDEPRLTGANDRSNAAVERYRAAAVAVCDDLGVRVVRAERVLEPLGADAFVDDGVHLTGRGYRLLLPAIADAVRSGGLMVLFGPPAVGKMTVGRALSDRSDVRLFLNHHTVDPLADVFGMGTPAFRTLSGEFRRRVVEEAAAADLSLALTLVWNLGGAQDAAWVSDLVAPYASAGLPVLFVELVADLPTRLERNHGEDRLLAKPSKRDLAWSEAHLREREAWATNTHPDVVLPADDLLAAHHHLRIDTRDLTPAEAAERILGWRRSLE